MSGRGRSGASKEGPEEKDEGRQRDDRVPELGPTEAAPQMPAMLLDPRLDHPANAGRRACLLRAGQRTLGNHTVQRLLQAEAVQPKLTVNPPDDVYEQEADRVAETVMAMLEPPLQRQPQQEEEPIQGKAIAAQISPLVQRQPEEEEEGPIQEKGLAGPATVRLQRQEEEPVEEEPIQARTLPGPVAALPGPPQGRIQREDGQTTTPSSRPEFRLQTPSLLGPSPPPFPHIRLEIPPLVLNLLDERLDPERVRRGLSQIEPGAPLPPSPAPAAGREPPAEAVTPPPTPPAEQAPLVPPAAGPATPREASAGDVLRAIAAVPAIDSALSSLQTLALDQLRRDWERLSTGERVAAVTAAVLVGGGALAGALSHPETRQAAVEMLNGRTFPVPGVNGLGVELNLQGSDWMVGLHLDVGALLPESWGFGPSSPSAIGGPPTPVQRQAEPEEEEEEEPVQASALSTQAALPVQRQAEPDEEPVQTRAEPGQTPRVTPELETQISALRGGGQSLSASERAFFEPRLDQDLSQVRIHTGGAAAETAQALQARAFTIGQDVVFGAGQYTPGSEGGRRLLAHELTHVVQQTGRSSLGGVPQAPEEESRGSNLSVPLSPRLLSRTASAVPAAQSRVQLNPDLRRGRRMLTLTIRWGNYEQFRARVRAQALRQLDVPRAWIDPLMHVQERTLRSIYDEIERTANPDDGAEIGLQADYNATGSVGQSTLTFAIPHRAPAPPAPAPEQGPEAPTPEFRFRVSLAEPPRRFYPDIIRNIQSGDPVWRQAYTQASIEFTLRHRGEFASAPSIAILGDIDTLGSNLGTDRPTAETALRELLDLTAEWHQEYQRQLRTGGG